MTPYLGLSRNIFKTLLFQTATQLASSPKCTAQKKREYVKTVMWAAKQIAKTYESKLGAGEYQCVLFAPNLGRPIS